MLFAWGKNVSFFKVNIKILIKMLTSSEKFLQWIFIRLPATYKLLPLSWCRVGSFSWRAAAEQLALFITHPLPYHGDKEKLNQRNTKQAKFSLCKLKKMFVCLLSVFVTSFNINIWSVAVLLSGLYLLWETQTEVQFTQHTWQRCSFNTPTCRAGNFLCTVTTSSGFEQVQRVNLVQSRSGNCQWNTGELAPALNQCRVFTH